MKHRFKFDTSFRTSGDLYVVRVSTCLLGRRHHAEEALSLEQIAAANFDIVQHTVERLEAKMEMHLAKISSS